jgi:hypothetical protein
MPQIATASPLPTRSAVCCAGEQTASALLADQHFAAAIRGLDLSYDPG